MPEQWRTRTTGGQVKVQRAATQTTLKDLFQRTNFGTCSTQKVQDLRSEHTDSVASSPQPADPCPPAKPSRLPKSSQLYPIFTKVSTELDGLRETDINTDNAEVIAISSDTNLSTERPLSSAQLLSPRSDSSHATPRSRSPPPIVLSTHCSESATSLSHGGTHKNTFPLKTNRDRELNKRTLGLGDDTPLPSSCSQHVRGSQRSYTFGQAPLKRSILPSSRPSNEGTLDFLKRWVELDDIPSTSLGHIHRFLTSRQCEEYLQSLSRDYTESHPAFAQICVHQEKFPLRHVEMWTRRFRPRRANEVLGNEQHAIYLRDWLRALELRLRDCQPQEAASRGAPAGVKEKSALKRVERRGVKRPRVIRAVTRKRGKKKRRVDSEDDLDDFVVFSDTDEEPADDLPEDSEDEVTFCQRTLARLHRHDTADVREVASSIGASKVDHKTSRMQESTQANFADGLTNTLLITGPPGCGKTAAVYACAEELGWEIFEVYPGIGRRNGANLEHLIGNVGRNHIVQTAHSREQTKTTKAGGKEPMERVGLGGLGGYLARGERGRYGGFGKTQEAGTEGQPIIVEADGPMDGVQTLPVEEEMESSDEVGMCGTWQGGSEGSRGTVGQSLVLLEEVDILFEDDGGFWPAVIEFIQGCQRPVVMTCNDPGLVPVEDLPVQKVLVFEPCPSTVAATFLQCMSLTEGCLVPHEDLMALYESTHGIEGVEVWDGPLYARTGREGLPDLRRSITELQMFCAGARHGSGSEMHQGEEAEGHVRRSARPISAERRDTAMGSTVEKEWWREMRRHGELMSHVDAQFCRPAVGTREVEEEEEEGVLSRCGREGLMFHELIAEEAIRQSRGVGGECGTGRIEASIKAVAGLRARVEYRSRMVEALQGIVDGPAGVMGERRVFLDYIPWVREMVTVEDVLERGLGRAPNGVRTRKGGGGGGVRGGYLRTLGGSDGQRAAVRASRLGSDSV